MLDRVYQKPTIACLSYFQIIAMGQSIVNHVPSSPDNICGDASCTAFEPGPDTFDIHVTWSDDPGTSLSVYTVKVHAEPDNHDYILKDMDPSQCLMNETPSGSGNYVMNCSGVPMQFGNGNSCNCNIPNSVAVVSISDGENTLEVSNEVCSSIPRSGSPCT